MDKAKFNQKFPVVFLLDSELVNPLNCSDKMKRYAAFRCYNCPSVNGNIGCCCHIAFLILFLSAVFIFCESVNKPGNYTFSNDLCLQGVIVNFEVNKNVASLSASI